MPLSAQQTRLAVTLDKPRHDIVDISGELSRLCPIDITPTISTYGFRCVRGCSLSLHGLVTYRAVIFEIQSA